MQKQGTLAVRKTWISLSLAVTSSVLLAGAEGSSPLLFPGHQCGPSRTWGSAEGVATQISNMVKLLGARLRKRLSPDNL